MRGRVMPRIVDSGQTVYGVNTGFGLLPTPPSRGHDLDELQRNLVLSHGLRVSGRCSGQHRAPDPGVESGVAGARRVCVRRETVQMLGACWKPGPIPASIEGSVGASGDLAPLAHMSAVLLGIGEARVKWRNRGRRHGAGYGRSQTLTSGPKEGLVFSTARRSPPRSRSPRLSRRKNFCRRHVAGAMSTDALKGFDTPFDARIHALRGQPARSRSPPRLRGLMADSEDTRIPIARQAADDKVQILFLRCQPQVMGAVSMSSAPWRRHWRSKPTASPTTRWVVSGHGSALRRQFPRRAGGVRRRPAGAGAVRDRQYLRTPCRRAGRSEDERVAGFFGERVWPQLRLHDRQVTPQHGGGEPMLAHPASIDTVPPPQPGRSRLDCDAWRAPACSTWRRTPPRSSAIELLAAVRGWNFTARSKRRRAGKQRAWRPRAVKP